MLRLDYIIVAIATTAAGVGIVEMAQVEDRATSFRKLPISDVTFGENLVFEVDARSKLDCAQMCASRDGCGTYTFTVVSGRRGTCRGHSSTVDNTSPTTPAPASSAYKAVVDVQASNPACDGVAYTVLDEAWRDSSVNTGGNANNCDRTTLTAGWYKFLLNGADAMIPTTCVEKYHCGTDVSMWLNLQGASLPAVGQDLQTESCGGWTTGCCTSSYGSQQPVTVRNCGTFYIYNLVPPTNCQVAYCVKLRK